VVGLVLQVIETLFQMISVMGTFLLETLYIETGLDSSFFTNRFLIIFFKAPVSTRAQIRIEVLLGSGIQVNMRLSFGVELNLGKTCFSFPVQILIDCIYR
jgi:hypothetical protein